MSGATRYHAGLEAERSVARAYLRQGARFLEHRFRPKDHPQAGEIDLIMRDGDQIVFVEVKCSRTHDLAAIRLSKRQRARIADAAAAYLATQPGGQASPSRFDLALVDHVGRVEIVSHAFDV